MCSLHATLEGVMYRSTSLPDPLACMREDTEDIDDSINRMRTNYEIAVTTGERN